MQSSDVDQCVEAIIRAARTGKIGDGKIFITSVERVVQFALASKTLLPSDTFLNSKFFIAPSQLSEG